VDLIVGAYRDENGKPYVLDSVREAERRILAKHMDHEYAGIVGVQNFVDLSLEFIYGPNSTPIKEGRVAAMQTLSGTGGCRVAAEFLMQTFGRGAKIHLPNPTWSNHLNVMRQAGLVPEYYPYFKAADKSFDFDAMMKFLEDAPDQTLFLLHVCAHNPTGCDPTNAEWDQISALMKKKNHVALMDCAYQGFASGDAVRDAYAVRKFVDDGHNFILAQSFAKVFLLWSLNIM
jgi:aspartate aminotransferase